MTDLSLEALVEKLPEVYQPIYGAPEINASRASDEGRVVLLLGQVAGLSSAIGRPLRILDLGCAQGYLSFRMAEQGHEVTGVESLDLNIAVARAIQARHPDLNVAFVEGDLPGVLAGMDLGRYDVVVAFSVLHHVAHRDGHETAAQMVADLVAEIPNGLFEMAIPSEPLFWAGALPADPRMTLSAYAFVREIGHTATHLSDVVRPIFFCSRSFCLVQDELIPISSYSERSHADANAQLAGTQRYFTLPIGIAKIAANFGEWADESLISDLKSELGREAASLISLRQEGLEVPELIEFVDRETETILVRTMYPGVLLSEVVESLSDEERESITTQVLVALGDLEERRLYHQDLRLWNVIWDRSQWQAHVIDYGSILASPDDTMWPFDSHFSLLIFLSSLWSRRPDQTGLQVPRSLLLSLDGLDRPAAKLISSLAAHPGDDHVIRDLIITWDQIRATQDDEPRPALPMALKWIAQVELQREEMRSERDAQVAEQERLRAGHELQEKQLAQHQRDFIDLEAEQKKQLERIAADQVQQLEVLRRQLVDQLVDLEAQQRSQVADLLAQHHLQLDDQQAGHQQEVARLEADLAQLRTDHDELAQQLNFIQQTVSWRATAPLRDVRAIQRRFRRRP